jgi:RNA polymerase sigma factor (sigma-70 family)
VFVELWKNDAKLLKSFQGRSAFTTWLSVIAYRVAAREFVRRLRARAAEAAKRPKAQDTRDGEALELLERLPEIDRRSIVMFHIHDCSYREISGRLGIPLNQVGMVLLRAREKLARILGRAPE